MINPFRKMAVGVPEQPDTTRICDFPEVHRISRRIDMLERSWYLIDGQQGLYQSTSSYFGELRARRDGEILWFRRCKEDEKSLIELAEILNRSLATKGVA